MAANLMYYDPTTKKKLWETDKIMWGALKALALPYNDEQLDLLYRFCSYLCDPYSDYAKEKTLSARVELIAKKMNLDDHKDVYFVKDLFDLKEPVFLVCNLYLVQKANPAYDNYFAYLVAAQNIRFEIQRDFTGKNLPTLTRSLQIATEQMAALEQQLFSHDRFRAKALANSLKERVMNFAERFALDRNT